MAAASYGNISVGSAAAYLQWRKSRRRQRKRQPADIGGGGDYGMALS